MGKLYIKIIVEGNEEKAFFDIVDQIGKDNKFVLDVEDAKGYGGIADAFLSALREGELFDCVICVFDVDNRLADKNSPYARTRKQLFSIFGNGKIVDAVSFCTNPNILQYFLLAADTLDKVSLKLTSKAENTPLVHKYWPMIASGKKDKYGRSMKSCYDASSWQLEIIKYSIINEEYSYSDLLENSRALSTDYKTNLPGGNLLPLLMALKDGDEEFFNQIHDLIDSCS